MDDKTLLDLFGSLSKEIGSFRQEMSSFRQEMKDGFGEVSLRLGRIDATLIQHGKQLGAGARAIAGFTEWVGKADADYARVLAELAEMKQRLDKLERGGATQ